MPKTPWYAALAALGAFALAGPLRAVEKVGPLVPPFDVTDTYVTSPTMLVRAGADGRIREIWSGMDAKRRRHVPLFLETLIYGEVRQGGAWRDLRTLDYHHDGTRPGYIRLVSEDGSVSIEITANRRAALSPIFVCYSFSQPTDFRLALRFLRTELTRAFLAGDAAGFDEFATSWRSSNGSLATEAGPNLVLATEPRGRTLSIDRTGLRKEADGVRGVLLCLDATESKPARAPSESYAEAWVRRLGGDWNEPSEPPEDRVSLASDDPKLDRLFADSIDAVESHQFASGDVMADLFFYRDSWLRDGTYSMIGLALAGEYANVERYFGFWSGQRDFSVGGEREAQQPAIGITGMWLYSRLSPDGAGFLRRVWPYVRYYGDYYDRRINREGMLNVAEEWICFLPSPATWPNAEIYSGERAAAKIARALGHDAEAARWEEAAARLKRRFDAIAYDPALGRIIPMAGPPGQVFRDPDFPEIGSHNGPLRDGRVDSGMLAIGRLEAFGKGQGVMAVDDPRYASTRAEIVRDLENPDHAIFRFGPNPSNPHAPEGELDTWPINTAWAAQDEWLLGRTDLAWRYLLSGVMDKRDYDLEAACDYLPENWDRQGGVDKPILCWSHGDFVTSVLLLSLGLDLEPEGADLGVAPSLPPGSNRARIGNFRFRNWRLDFDLRRSGEGVEVTLHALLRPAAPGSGEASGGDALRLRLPSGEVLRLASGQTVRFAVDPARYYAAFGRSANAAERARIVSKVLLGREPPPGAVSTPAAAEDFLVKTLTDYRPQNQ